MIDGLQTEDYLLQAIEECGEAAAAASKLLRKWAGRNYTPRLECECFLDAVEEAVDAKICLDQMLDALGISETEISERYEEKLLRWEERQAKHKEVNR